MPLPIKLVRGGPRRMPVTAPRKVLGPSASLESLNTEDIFFKANGPENAPASPVEIDSKPWVVAKPDEVQKDWSDERPPAWSRKSGEWNDTPLLVQPKFTIHEPHGPAWYINHHLKPPPSATPRTSFPPSAFSPIQTQSLGSAPTSRPSPSRSRTYTDVVDSLDVSDPHGQRWHHPSPYELGRKNTARPRSSVVGPGVGTYAGAIEGSEFLDQVSRLVLPDRHIAYISHWIFTLVYFKSPPGSSSSTSSPPSSNGRLHPRSRNSSSIRLAPSPLSQSTSAYDLGKSSPDLSRPPQPAIINLDDNPPQIPSSSEVPDLEPSTSSTPADQPLIRSRSASPLKPASPSPHPLETAKSAPPEINKRNKRESSRRTTGHLFGLFGSSSTEASTPHGRRRSVSATTHRDSLTRKRSRRSSQVGSRPTSPSAVAPNIISAPTTLKTQLPRTATYPDPVARIQAEEKREKRGTMFGRLMKKFSTVRKPGITWEDTAVRPGKVSETVIPDTVPDVLAPDVHSDPTRSTTSLSAALASTFDHTAEPVSPDIRDLYSFTDLPHHLPTPKISSPLVIHPPMSPSPEPQPLMATTMALTIANPDIDIPATPSPPRRTVPLADVNEPPPLVAPSPVRYSTSSEDPRSSSDDRKHSHQETTPRRHYHDPQPNPERTPTRESDYVSRSSVPLKSAPSLEDHLRVRERDGARERSGDRDHRRDTPDRTRDRSRERDRPRERSREKDRHRERSRERDRARDRSRERDRPRDRSRERDRPRDRLQERDRPSDPSGDKDRSRDRSRDKRLQRESTSSLEGRTYDEKRKDWEDRHRRRHASESPTKASSPTSRSAHRESRQGGQMPTPSTAPLVIRERRSHGESETEQSGSSSSRRPLERPSLHSLPSGQGHSSSSHSGHSSSTPPVPKSGQPSPSSRRKQPSLETISALGKEWEVVADSPSHRRSRSREQRQAPEKTDPILNAVVLENAWTGPQSRARHIVKGRRSASADSSTTSSGRKPPTPPPKHHSVQSPRPPTTGPHSPRASHTPPSRRSSPSPSPSPTKPVISGPVPMQRSRSRRDSSSRAETRSVRHSPTKPNGARPPNPTSPTPSSSTQRTAHRPSASTEDLVSTRDMNLRAKDARERERMRKGQSWNASDESPEEEQRQLQLRLAVIRGTQAGHGRPPTSQSAGNGSADGGAVVARAGSSHTSFSLQAPLMLTSRGQQGSTPPLTAPVVDSSGYYGQHPSASQVYVSTTPYYLGGTMPLQSYPHSQSRFGYEAAPPAASAAHPHLIHSPSLPAGYPPSSSLPDLPLNSHSSQPNLPLNTYASPPSLGSNYVQFSTRAPYPIAPYPYNSPTSPWTQYPSPS